MVKRAVKLDVVQAGTLPVHDVFKSTHLMKEEHLKLCGIQLDTRAPELTWQTRMRPDPNPAQRCRPNTTFHGVEIARVDSAGNVDGIHPRHQSPGLGGRFALAQITIEVEKH